MRHILFRLGRFKLLVVEPHYWAYGHLALEILMSLEIARRDRAWVYFLQRKNVVNKALFEIRSDEVKILSRTGWCKIPVLVLWQITREARRFFRGIRQVVKSRKRATVECNGRNQMLQRPYLRRLLIKEPVDVQLPGDQKTIAAKQAAQLGITPGTRIVTLHVRENGFHSARGHAEFDEQSLARNARIETYDKAIVFLVEQGYVIVRIGDPTMKPLTRPGVIDLATSPHRTELVELYCLMRSVFLIGCESGSWGVSHLTNTPLLVVNATDPISAYPVRRDSLYILKKVVERKSGRMLSLLDMVQEDYLRHLRDMDRYQYIDNSGDEILEAVREMVRNPRGQWEPTAPQREYKKLVSDAAGNLGDKLPYVRKWGPEDGFLGDGWIGQRFVELNLYNT